MIADDPRQDLPDIGCRGRRPLGRAGMQLPLGDAFEYARQLHAELPLTPRLAGIS